LCGGGSDIEVVEFSFEIEEFSAKGIVFLLEVRNIMSKFSEAAAEFFELC